MGKGAINISVSGGAPPYLFDWFDAGGVFSHEEDVAGLHFGSYSIYVTGANGCTAYGHYIINNTTGTHSPEAMQAFWDVYPNPATSYLNIAYKGDDTPDAQFRLLDATGRLVREKHVSGTNTSKLDISVLPAGAYALWIQTPVGTVSRIITIER
jgi:hypothetical protein